MIERDKLLKEADNAINWIKEYVDLSNIEVDELIKRFGLSTAEIEGVEYKGKDIENVVVAKILTVENHPNSNHLHILTVDDGSGAPVQVVCGAPNVRVGLKTFFARVGGNVRGLKIKPAKSSFSFFNVGKILDG